MGGKNGWGNIPFLARALDEAYPETDLLSLSDGRLKEMLLSLEETAGFPDLSEDKVYFWTLKSAWAVVQNGGIDDSGDVPDAYV